MAASGDSSWSLKSWKSRPAAQQPQYADEEHVSRVEETLARLPPLVHPDEVRRLRSHLAEVHAGKRFLLQGGDCAERFDDCHAGTIEKKLKILLQMSLILIWGGRLPVVRIGRIAGQYSKPRSSQTETVDGKVIPTFRGDSINGFDPADRNPDPERLVHAYFHSAATSNYLRSLMSGGFSSLHHSSDWDLAYVNNPKRREQYQTIVKQLLRSLDFMETVGATNDPSVSGVDLFVSHEGLVLPYEAALTRECEGEYFNLGAHFIWIGDRTRQIDGAHVEYMRGIQNPVGVKVGPTTPLDKLVELVSALNPDNDPGKVVLITRLSAERVHELLPPIIQTVQAAKLNVVWQCDPMHGNTFTTDNGTKTRSFDVVLDELTSSFAIHKEQGSRLGGVHFELTGDDVTECTGGPQDLHEGHLSEKYTTYCDPRLNYAQSMEMAFRLADLIDG